MEYRYQDIFVPGGFPKLTYNPRNDLRIEAILREAQDNLCKLVTVTGQTKSGKTVLAKNVYPKGKAIWIDGGSVATEDDFWQVIIDHLHIAQVSERETSSETTGKAEGKVSAGAGIWLAKASTELTGGMEVMRGSAMKGETTLSSRITAIRGLEASKLPLVVDDFHYIPREIQGSIVRALKQPIFEGLTAVIIAIPHRRYDALKVEKEMTGRISPIDVPSWSIDELRFIPETGFALLNIKLTDDVKNEMASQSLGSPHLMQDFCRMLCKSYSIQQNVQEAYLVVKPNRLEEIFREVAETIGRPIFEKLARGPRGRTDRIPRILKDGRSVDIYQLVLQGLAHLKPDLISIEYETLRVAIKEVSESPTPQVHEIARVLKQMAMIASTDQSSTPVIDFEEEEKKVHITDPYFAFYLRWGELAAEKQK